MYLRIFLLLIGYTIGIPFSFSQIQDSLYTATNNSLKREIITLEAMIDSAIIHSPITKRYDAMITSSEFDYEAFKKSWAKELSISFESKYGEYGNSFALDDLSLGYGGMIRINVPLSLFVGRKSAIQAKYYSLQALAEKREEIIQILKLEIIERYKTLLLAENNLEIRSEAYTNSKINFEYAQLQYNENEIGLEAYVRISDYYISCRVNFQEAKANYWSSMVSLEEIVGVKITIK